MSLEEQAKVDSYSCTKQTEGMKTSWQRQLAYLDEDELIKCSERLEKVYPHILFS